MSDILLKHIKSDKPQFEKYKSYIDGNPWSETKPMVSKKEKNRRK